MNRADKLAAYNAYRDYFLVTMLVSIPPQRKQILNGLSVQNLEYRGRVTVLSVSGHKTQHIYGDVVVTLPTTWYDDFQKFLELRRMVVSVDVGSLFVNSKGEREKQLTKRFQTMVAIKFKQRVNIRDCRTLFVTHASKNSSLSQMLLLSKRMYHSFKTQQEIYSCENAIEFAITNLQHCRELVDDSSSDDDEFASDFDEDFDQAAYEAAEAAEAMYRRT